MISTIQSDPTLTMLATPQHPSVLMSAEEDRISRLPGILHFFEPNEFAGSPLVARDRAHRGHYIATPSTAITVGASAAYNNKPVITKAAANAAFAYDAGTAPQSFTMIIACDAVAAGGSLMGFYSGAIGASTAKYALSWRSDVGKFQFAENYASNTSPLLLDVVNMPALNTPFVLALTYDRLTRESRMFINSADVKASITHTGTQPVIDPTTRIAIGGLYQYGSAGWNGRIGRALFMNRAYHAAEYLPFLDKEIAAMRAYYAI